MKAYKTADNGDAATKASLHLNRVLGSFNDAVLKYVRLIIDEYHRKVPVSSNAVYEFGPIKISLLPGYNQNDENIIEFTSAVNRQELHAVKLINSCPSTSVNTMLVTCVEYKGFRFSAYLEVPLGSNVSLNNVLRAISNSFPYLSMFPLFSMFSLLLSMSSNQLDHHR